MEAVRSARFLGVCWAAIILGQVYVSAQVAGVKPTLGGQPVLVQPTTVPGYKDCITNVTSSKCVGGNSIRAQAPFDPSTACPTDSLYDATGQLISNDIIAAQLGACINAVRENPDAFACFYNCNYSDWRDSVVTPARGGLVTTGSDGATELQTAAEQHSLDMATQNYFAHTGSDGSGLEDRAANNGFYTFPLGENIAAGYISIQSVVLAWMCSEGHRTNLMGCGFDTVGSGSAYSNTSDYVLYFTQDFGCSRDDFNCQCPQPVNASANQVPSPAPVCPGAGPVAAPAAAPLAAAPGPATLLEVPATGPAVASQLAAAPVPVPAAGAAPKSATPAPAPDVAASQVSAAAPVPGASTASGVPPLSAAAPAPAPSAFGASAPLPELGVPTAISYTTADEGAQYSAYYARPGPGGAPAGGPLPELGVPTAISYTTADEGAQYSAYYIQGGPGSAPAGGPVPELGVPTAISYTDVGLGSYSGKFNSNTVRLSTMAVFPGPLVQSGAPSAGAQAPPAGYSPSISTAAQGSASSSAYAQGPTASFLGTRVAPGLYATAMELPGYTGALATTNSQTAVLVLTLLAPAAVNTSDVSLALQGGAQGTVADVQAFPDQASSYLVEVQHPSGFVGDVVVSLPSHPEIPPLTYQVVARNLVVQSLGFNLCSASSSTS